MIDNVRRNPLMQGLQVKPEDEFGPSDRHCGFRPPPGHLTATNTYGPVQEEYGPPLSAIQKSDDSGPAMATFRIHKRVSQPGHRRKVTRGCFDREYDTIPKYIRRCISPLSWPRVASPTTAPRAPAPAPILKAAPRPTR
jgi:hypothetical protein